MVKIVFVVGQDDDMGVDGDTVKLQQQSSGIIFDNYQGKWITCVYEEEGIVNKEEKYIFRYVKVIN